MLDTIAKSLSSLQLRELQKFGSKITKFGVNFAVCDVNSKLALMCESDEFRSNREYLVKSSGCCRIETTRTDN